jgi:hypothetical protein
MGTIYKLTSKTSGKSYVGATTIDLPARLGLHLVEAKWHKASAPFPSAVREFGPEDFIIEILCTVDDKNELFKVEAEMMHIHNTIHPNGYNVSVYFRGTGIGVKDLITGIVYGSIREAAKATKTSPSNVKFSCDTGMPTGKGTKKFAYLDP